MAVASPRHACALAAYLHLPRSNFLVAAYYRNGNRTPWSRLIAVATPRYACALILYSFSNHGIWPGGVFLASAVAADLRPQRNPVMFLPDDFRCFDLPAGERDPASVVKFR